MKYVTEERDQRLKTQNCGVMVEADGVAYYGILEAVVELVYTEGMSVILFKCRWYDTETKQMDYGLLSLDTSTSVFEDSPFILASTARQVFYLDDPKAGEPWRVVNMVTQRGVYSPSTLATAVVASNEVNEPYQECTYIPIQGFTFDYGELPDLGDSYNLEDPMDVSDEDDEASDDDEDDNSGYEDDLDEEDVGGHEEEGEDDYDDEWLR